jgi:hypothetical protein
MHLTSFVIVDGWDSCSSPIRLSPIIGECPESELANNHLTFANIGELLAALMVSMIHGKSSTSR